jgi:hypothetical protein
LVKLNAEVKNDKTEIAKLKRANTDLKNQLDNIDRNSRRKNLLISGIPYDEGVSDNNNNNNNNNNIVFI